MPSLEYLIEKEVVPVLQDIADSLKKIANPARTIQGATFRVRFGDTVGVYDSTTGKLLEKIKDVDWMPGLEDPR